MEQRPLRLGDIVDDYCPRERRITNHVVAALMGDAIKQTRCSTCDVEHGYKGARPPSRKKKDVTPLETAVLASVNGTQLVARIDPTAPPARNESPASPSTTISSDAPGAVPLAAASNPADANQPEGEASEPADPLPGAWIGHRTLIRAQLPRTDNDPPPPRPIPEFTMHQRQTRGSHQFRGGQGWGGRGGGGGGPRGNFAHSGGNGNGPERNGNVGGANGPNHSNSFGGHHGGPGHPGQGNGQGRPPGQGRKRHRHGKHRPPPR